MAPKMRWMVTGLLVGVLGALFNLNLSWPGDAGGVARTGVSLAEFQRGIRIDQLRPPALVAVPVTLRSADNPTPPAGPDTALPQAEAAGEPRPQAGLAAAAAEPTPEPAQPDDRAPQTLFQETATAPVQATEPPPAEPSSPLRATDYAGNIVAEATPAADPLRQPGPVTTAAEPPPAVPDPVARTQVPTAPAEPPPEAGSAGIAVEPGAGASPRQPADQATETVVPAVAAARAPAPDMRPTRFSGQNPIAGHHAGHISIHYHVDDRSRLAAQRAWIRLASAGLGTVEMHTSVHVVPSPVIRYFSPQDAPVATSLARTLGRDKVAWQVEDCTAFRRKPAPGSVQIWPSAAE
jgi:hypothetical protein